MSLDPGLEEKRKIELPRALREIVRILADEGPKTYEELAEKLEKDETTVIRQAQKLVEMEIAVKVEKDGKAAVALAEGVEVDEEGNVYVPSPFEDPIEKLRNLLEEAGVKGRKLRWIMRLVESNPEALQQPQVLYETLVGSGIRRHLAEQIVKAYFGTNFVAPQPPMQPHPYPQYPGYGYYQRMGYPYPPYPPSYEKEILRLEMRLEKLLEELKEKKEEKPAYPVIRRIKTDESGKPIEVIEEPVWAAPRSDDSTKLIVQIMQQQQRDREEMLKTIFTLQQQTNQTIEKILSAMQQMQQQTQQRIHEILMEMEKKRLEEQAKLREEVYKRDMEWMKKFYEDRIQDLQQSIQGIKQYYEEQMKKVIEELKREWEWREKIRELEEKRGIRDIVVAEMREIAKEAREAVRQLREQMRDAMEIQLKERMKQTGVPQVAEEEKKRILEALRRATGKPSPKPQGKEEKEAGKKVKMKIVEGGEGK